MRKLYPVLGILFIGALVLAACGTPATEAPPPPPTEAPAAEEPADEPEPEPEPEVEEITLPDLDGREIQIANDNAYIPFAYINLETGEAEGWDYDFFAEACSRLNCVPVWQEFGWDTTIAAVGEGQFDLSTNGITITEERAEIVDFSDSYISTEQRLLVRLDDDRFDGPEAFAADGDAILSQQVGTTNHAVAEELIGGDRIITMDDFGLTIQAVLSGDTDGTILDDTAGQGYMGANADQLKMIGGSLSSDALGFIFPKGSDLVAPFNLVIAQMKQDGTLSEINLKWFGPAFDDTGITYDDIGDGAYGLGKVGNPLVWVLVPSQDAEGTLAGAELIAAAFEEQAGLIVNSIVTTDYTGAVEAMCSGEAHMGALNTFNYVLANARGCAEVGVTSVRFGSTFYSGQIITQAGSGIESVADLAGKTFCRPDPTSTSGWVIPSIAMQAEGIDPEADLAEIIDAGGHPETVIAVYNGDCDAGSTFVDARGNIEEEFADVMDVVVVIAESAPIPNDNISFEPGVSQEVRDALIGILLDLASTEEGLETLNSVYSWSGMEIVEDSFYDGFCQQLEVAGVDIEDLAS